MDGSEWRCKRLSKTFQRRCAAFSKGNGSEHSRLRSAASLPPDTFRPRFAVFLEFSDGRIRQQRNCDCVDAC